MLYTSCSHIRHSKSLTTPVTIYVVGQGNRIRNASFIFYLLFACSGHTTETTITQHMHAYRKLIRNGRCHIQVHGTTGCGKSRQVPSVTAEEVSYLGQTIVLTTSTVDVTGMHKDAWVKSCYRMGDRLLGGENINRFHCQFFNVLSCVWLFELQMTQWYRGTCVC